MSLLLEICWKIRQQTSHRLEDMNDILIYFIYLLLLRKSYFQENYLTLPPPKKKLHSQWYIAMFIPLRKKLRRGQVSSNPSLRAHLNPSRPLQVPPWWEHPYWVPTHHVRTYQKWVPWRREDHQQDFPFKRAQEMKVLALEVHFFLETCVFL